MTRYSDNIYTGDDAPVSAQASKSSVVFQKSHDFSGGSASTQTSFLPKGSENLDAKVWINSTTASAATGAKITVSAGGTTLITCAAMGSALGVLRTTTAGLGTITNVASATSILSGAVTSALSYSVTYAPASADTTGSFRIQLSFSRADGA